MWRQYGMWFNMVKYSSIFGSVDCCVDSVDWLRTLYTDFTSIRNTEHGLKRKLKTTEAYPFNPSYCRYAGWQKDRQIRHVCLSPCSGFDCIESSTISEAKSANVSIKTTALIFTLLCRRKQSGNAQECTVADIYRIKLEIDFFSSGAWRSFRYVVFVPFDLRSRCGVHFDFDLTK
jgi:hypothetical protein